jgi:DNA-binding response OmpR family regulator
MGFSLDASTIREIADAVATEVIQALNRSRISMQTDDRDFIEVGPLTVDLARREAALHGRALNLKPRELALLTVLARNAGRALSRDQLLELAWEDAMFKVDSERTVDVHVRRLRLRLGDCSVMLRTVARIGYRLDPPVGG